MSDSEGATAPAEVASEAPAGLRLGGIAVAGGLVISLVVHLALVGTVLVVSPRLGHPEAAAITVDLITPDEAAAETKQTQEAKPVQDSKPEEQKPPPKPELGQNGDQASSAQAAMSAPLASSALPLEALAPSFDAPPADAPPPAAGPPVGLSQLLGMQSNFGSPRSGGAPSEYKADLTASQIAGFGAHVQNCWTAPDAPADAPAVTVFVRVSLKRDGSLAGPPEPLGGSASLPAITLLKSALAALQKCPAYSDLPADKYDEWRVLDLRFTPSGISVAVPSSGNQRKPG